MADTIFDNVIDFRRRQADIMAQRQRRREEAFNRESGQSHMEFAVVEGWRRPLEEWRYQLGLRVPERRETRVGTFLCS